MGRRPPTLPDRFEQADGRRRDIEQFPLDLHFLKGRVKAEVGLAKGKKQHDKREAEKTRDWEREKARLMRVN